MRGRSTWCYLGLISQCILHGFVECFDDIPSGKPSVTPRLERDGVSFAETYFQEEDEDKSGPLANLSPDQRMLCLAVLANNTLLVEGLLLSKTISPDIEVSGASLLHLAVLSLDLPSLKMFIFHCSEIDTTDRSGNSPLHWAIVYEKPGSKLLLEAGADVNAIGSLGTPLHLVVHKRKGKEWLQLLLDFGADIQKYDSRGYAPIHVAAAQNSAEAFVFLIQAGADAFQPDWRNCFPFHHAVTSGCFQIIDYLIQEGADVNGYCGGRTPLHLALIRRRWDIIEHLLTHGANDTLPDGNGMSVRAILDLREGYRSFGGDDESKKFTSTHVPPAA